MPSPARPLASSNTLLIFALANAGGVIGFLPLLTLLLPIKIDAIAPDARIGIVTLTTLAGAVAASVSNILFGCLSDRSIARGGGRRRFVAGGVIATALSYVLIVWARSPVAIVSAIIVFQVAVNAMLGTILAIMADEIPDDRKGLAGGLLALANPLASGVSIGVVALAGAGEGMQLAIVAVAMAACALPLLLMPPSHRAESPVVSAASVAMARRDMVVTWVARLLVQIAGAVLFYYLLFYFQTVTRAPSAQALAARTGQLMLVAYVVPLPIAVLFGRLSDRSGLRKPFLLVAALLAATGLAAMATASGWQQAALAFGLYTVGSSTFLALHATFAMQLLPSVAHRGRDLGLLNLTNTLPALIAPALAWALASPNDFSVLMAALAALTALGGLVLLGVRGQR